MEWVEESNSEYEINYVHETEDHVSGFRPVVAVAGEHQDAGNDVMGEHLRMVFSSFFDIDHKDLLQPKRELHEVVPLESSV